MRVLFALVLSALSGMAAQQAQEGPNVLLITIDTLRADHLSSYGYHLRTSPNIDKLAESGVRFTRAHTVIPLTGPAHLSLFTGRYPQEHGGRINGIAFNRDARLVFLPQVLRSYGYTTAAFVSAWPLTSRMTQLNNWFDLYDEDLPREYQMVNSMRHASDVTPKALTWLRHERDKEQPFLLWVHYFDPHSPYELRERFADLEKIGEAPPPAPGLDSDTAQERIRQYNSEIGFTDYYIGILLDELERQDIYDNTLVVLVADHGESLGEHDYIGHGRQLYDPIVRIPLIMRLPGHTTAGKVVDSEVSIIDIASTVADLTVKKIDPDLQLPIQFGGRSLAKVINGDAEAQEQMVRFVTFGGKKGFLPKFIADLFRDKDGPPLKMGHTLGLRKVIYTPDDKYLEIFNIQQDPLELKPVEPRSKSPLFKTEVSRLKRWFDSTAGAAGENTMTQEDIKALKSLGYLQ